jgi:hypothetical protein
MVERPTDRSLAAIAVAGPRGRFVSDPLQRCKAATQALFGENREFYFGHVQPTGMFGRMVPNDPFEQSLAALQPESLDQRLGVVCVEVVQHHVNPTSMGVTPQQVSHEASEIAACAMPTGLYKSSPRRRFDSHKNTTSATTAIFVVLLGGLAGSRPLRRPHVVEHLIRLFVHANHRFPRIGRFFVLIQHVFHPFAKLRRQLRHAPSFFRHGFRSCAFSHKLTSLLLIADTRPRLTAYLHSNSSVQRTRPSGGAVQARATTFCLCRGVKSDGRPDRGASYIARSNPSVQNRLRTLRTVRSPHPTCSTICRSVKPAADFSSISARRTTRTGRVPDCTTSCNCCLAPSVRHTICSFMPRLIPPAAF